jgi:adenosylmethionine-8-amino-7-oxononanoate aminotransferase
VSPGPDQPDWLELGRQHVWLPYTQMKTAGPALPVTATRGMRIRLADGRELIDGIASWWTACHGYNHPYMTEAVIDQLERMAHVMFGGLGHEPAYELARRLAILLPGDLNHVFFSDSGSVAVEVALKMALQYWLNTGVQGKSRIVAFRRGYHGDTTGAMSVTDPDEGMHHIFKGLLPQQVFVDLPRSRDQLAEFDRLLARQARDVAAVIVEPLVQGAGGMRFHDPGVVAAIHAAAKRHNVLFIADEIFTGFGRTGRMFACEEAGIVPDIICLGKALTGGAMGLAATAATRRVYDAFLSENPGRALMHGPTYMANPLACAAANASLDLFAKHDRLKAVTCIEPLLRQSLEPCRSLPGVIDVRARGAIGVVQMDRLIPPSRLAWMKKRFVEEGVWLRPFGDIVYLTPAFIASAGDLETLTGSIVKVLKEAAAA